MAEPTIHDVARRQDEANAAMDRLTTALDRMTARLDALPDTIDRTYVRKDVAEERSSRVDKTIETLANNLKAHAEQTQEQFDRLSATVRWIVAAIIIPVALAVFALLNAHGGVK